MKKNKKEVIDLVDSIVVSKTNVEKVVEQEEPVYETNSILIGYEQGRYNIQFPVEDIGGFVERECTSTRTFYELEVLNVVKELNLTGVYLDCGGYIGNHALFFSKHTNATKVFSFEPNNTSFNCLKENTKDCQNVTLFNIGVSDTKDKKQLYRAGHNDGCCDSLEEYKDNVHKKQEVTTDTLDNVVLPKLEETDNVVFLKLDIEGHELKALKGAVQIIDKYKPIIYTEIWREFHTFQGIYDLLTPRGYNLCRMEGQHIYWKYTEGKPIYTGFIHQRFLESLRISKAATIEYFLQHMRETYKLYATNTLSDVEYSTLEAVGAWAKANYDDYKMFGFTPEENKLPIAKAKLIKKDIKNYLYQAGSLEGLSIFCGRDILVLNLELANNETINNFTNNLSTYLLTLREEGCLILTIPDITLIDTDIYQNFIDNLIYKYSLGIIDENRIRYCYYSELIGNKKTFYIRL